MIEPKDRTSASWIAQLKQGEPKAWEQFLPRYGGMVYALFRRFGLREQDWEDVLQDILIALFQRIGGYTYNRDKPSFRPWLVPFIRCRVSEHWRKTGRCPRPLDDEKLEDLCAEVADASDCLLEEDHKAYVLSRILAVVKTRVPPKQWEAFYLMTQQGQSGREVAHALRLSVDTVFVYNSRVTEECRKVRAELGLEL